MQWSHRELVRWHQWVFERNNFDQILKCRMSLLNWCESTVPNSTSIYFSLNSVDIHSIKYWIGMTTNAYRNWPIHYTEATPSDSHPSPQCGKESASQCTYFHWGRKKKICLRFKHCMLCWCTTRMGIFLLLGFCFLATRTIFAFFLHCYYKLNFKFWAQNLVILHAVACSSYWASWVWDHHLCSTD